MSLTVTKRDGSPYWQIVGTLDGRRIRKSSGTTDEAQAEQKAARLEVAHFESSVLGPAAVLKFSTAAAFYRAAGKSTRFLEPIEDHWKDTLVRHITPGKIKLSATELYPEASAATRNRQVIVPTQAIINHAAEMDLCPPIRVKRFGIEKRRQDYATWEWVETFMRFATTPEIGALACFMYCTGARVSDALALTWGRVRLAHEVALVDSRKTKRDDWAHLPRPLVIALANLANRADKDEARVFPFKDRFEIRAPWMATIKAAGLPRMTTKACRHGFATALLRKGVDAKTVAKLGRWANPSQVLDTYGHANEDITIVDLVIGTELTHEQEKNRVVS